MLLEYVLVIWIGDNGAASSTIWANAGSKNALVSDGFKVQGAKKALTWMWHESTNRMHQHVHLRLPCVEQQQYLVSILVSSEAIVRVQYKQVAHYLQDTRPALTCCIRLKYDDM
jgi:hypothetical protein